MISTGSPVRVGVVSTFPPTRCGIARFASSLTKELTKADSSIDVDVVRLIREANPRVAHPPVVMEIDPDSRVGVRSAARLLSGYDIALIQHEFGIFGRNDGESVLDLVRQINAPSVVVLHTVLPRPSERQRRITRDLAGEATLVVLCRSAADMLQRSYGIPAERVEVIPHGSSWSPVRPNSGPHRELITWGLLGPGKGIERCLQALTHLRDLDPPVRYQVVGRTHPVVAERMGFSYGAMLEDMARELGVSDMVEFVHRYVDDYDLFRMVAASDVVVAPYDNSEQVSSGVVAEAVGIGRPVVATQFPYSEEMLNTGAGITVSHDPEAMADALRRLLTDENLYGEAAATAASISLGLNWQSAAGRYAELLRNLASSLATA